MGQSESCPSAGYFLNGALQVTEGLAFYALYRHHKNKVGLT